MAYVLKLHVSRLYPNNFPLIEVLDSFLKLLSLTEQH